MTGPQFQTRQVLMLVVQVGSACIIISYMSGTLLVLEWQMMAATLGVAVTADSAVSCNKYAVLHLSTL